MLLHFVSTPYFTPETVQKEQGIIAQEIRMARTAPARLSIITFWSCSMSTTPSGIKLPVPLRA